MHIRIGTRMSQLALAQTQMFIDVLSAKMEFTYDIVKINTTGDKIQDKKLYDIGGKALFLKELEEALLANHIDCAVHSMKDVPGHLQEKLMIGGVLARGNPYDTLISDTCATISDLPQNAVIGTSSARRMAQILRKRSDIQIVDLRGNVGTRIDKWRNNDKMDGIILAAAGLERLNMLNQDFCHVLSSDEMLPAVGQGVIAIEIAKDNTEMHEMCSIVNHQTSFEVLRAERGFLEYLNADCSTPLAAFAERLDNGQIKLRCALGDYDLNYYFTTERLINNVKEAYDIGVDAAKELQSMCKFI